MKNRLEKKDSVGNRFDELAKILAGGLTRRKTLQLIGGSVLAVYLATGRAWGAATGSCKDTCASLFNKDNMAAFNACTKACEDCKSCGGTPSFGGTLVCVGATPCRRADGKGKLTCCQDGAECCQGMCLKVCPLGTVRDPQTCGCSMVMGPDRVLCLCGDGAPITVCADVLDCAESSQVDAICVPTCSTHGGLTATACIDNDPMCAG